MAFSTITLLLSYHVYLVPKRFYHPGETVFVKQSLPSAPSQPLAVTSLLPVSIEPLIIDIVYDCNRTIWWFCPNFILLA